LAKLKALIIEDEEDALVLLSSIIKEYIPSIEVLGSATNLKGSLDLMSNMQPDLVFCDIQLQDCNIFDILDTLETIPFKLIFTTAYDEYALSAFKYNAVHYILKPYTPSEVIEAINRIHKSNTDGELIKRLAQELNRQKTNRIAISSFGQIKMINIHNIIYIEAERSYSSIYTKGSASILTSRPLREFNDILPDHLFIRVHTSFLVNIDHISEFIKEDGGILVLSDNSKIPVSRRRKKEVIRILLNN